MSEPGWPRVTGGIRPTRRGVALVLVVVLALLVARAHGARSLDAVVVPLLVASVAAVATVLRADPPRVERRPVRPAPVGERRTVELVLAADPPVSATVADAFGEGLAAAEDAAGEDESAGAIEGAAADRDPDRTAERGLDRAAGRRPGGGEHRVELTVTDETVVSYDVRALARGVHEAGPTTVAVRDVLGLLERRFVVDEREPVVAYPRVLALREDARRDLAAIVGSAHQPGRGEFDRLREYERGDALRDVHWPSTAKRPGDELLVKAYDETDGRARVTLVAEATPGRADAMATAAATVATHLLELGVAVEVIVPAGADPAGSGEPSTGSRGVERRSASTDPDEVLRPLADAGAGEVTERRRREADASVRADGDGTTVAFGGRRVPFERLCDESARTSVGASGSSTQTADRGRPSAGDRGGGRGDDDRGVAR